METETNITEEREFVFRRLEEALRLFGREADPRWFWIFVLVLVLGAGCFYVGVMYRRDSRSVGWAWASLLATLRCAVYFILAAVFLLPALQTWEKLETRSKVLLVFDVSGSMSNKDDPPTDKVPVDKLPSRQDKVISLVTDGQTGFLKNLLEKNPLSLYRFGGRADEEYKTLQKDSPIWSVQEWSDWLKPDPKQTPPNDLDEEEKAKFAKRIELYQQLVGGTNLADSLAEVLNRESNNMLQGVVVFSDGRSTQYSSHFEELRARARRAKVPLFTVVVGEHRRPINIRITDLQAPEQARPDDKFPVRVEVDGEGLPNAETNVSLDVTKPNGEKKTYDKPVKFNAGSGGPPHAQIEFEIDAAQLGVATEGKRPELEEGEWVFVARIPRDKREIFLDKEHVSDKATVRIIKKPLRVLLFAGSPTHDYQFLRTLLVREVDQRRAELSIYLQLQRPGIVQDVSPDRLLRHFPDRLGDAGEKAEDRYYSLSQYDLIIAFDPDWSQLQPEQLAALEKWVGQQAGGLILVAGPVNTYQLARIGAREKLKPVLDLFPVMLQDSVLQNLSMDRPATDPWRLNFPGATAEMEFLKLGEESNEPLAGWEQFFTGHPKAEVTKDTPVVRGFYTFYPVADVKPSGTVVATFADPRARLRDGAKEQPYLVTMPYGSGKVVYIGSGETWRLRQYREVFHERFWTKLARFAGAGTLSRISHRGVLVMGREFPAGQIIRLEAQLFGRDLQPLNPTAVPKVVFTQAPRGAALPAPVDLAGKPRDREDWNGWFQGRISGIKEPGEYRLELQIPETGGSLPGRFSIKESNPELDNRQPDFEQMYQFASEVTEVLPRMEKATQDEIKRALEGTAARLPQHRKAEESSNDAREPTVAGKAERPAGDSAAADKTAVPRLFFDLNSAHLIPKCMEVDTKTSRSRGPVKDLWDEGFAISSDSSVRMATVLLLITAVLSFEWLTRKLLKLA